jgi:hypothetical protein
MRTFDQRSDHGTSGSTDMSPEKQFLLPPGTEVSIPPEYDIDGL